MHRDFTRQTVRLLCLKFVLTISSKTVMVSALESINLSGSATDLSDKQFDSEARSKKENLNISRVYMKCPVSELSFDLFFMLSNH